MKCGNCRAEVLEGLKSCPFCGNELPQSVTNEEGTNGAVIESDADKALNHTKSKKLQRSIAVKSFRRRQIAFIVIGASMTIAGVVINNSLSIILGIIQLVFGIFGLVITRKSDGNDGQRTSSDNNEKKDPAAEKAKRFARITGIISVLGLILLNYRMIPLRAGAHTLVFFAIAILDIFLFIQYTGLQNRQTNQRQIMKYAMIPIVIFLLSCGLRAVYEIKAVPFRTQTLPDEMRITFYEKHQYYSNTNIQYGSVSKKSESVFFFINGKECTKDNAVVIQPKSGFQFEIRIAGSFNYSKKTYYGDIHDTMIGKKTEMICFEPDSFVDGKFTTDITVPMEGDSDIYAIFTVTFTKYDSFWEVLFS